MVGGDTVDLHFREYPSDFYRRVGGEAVALRFRSYPNDFYLRIGYGATLGWLSVPETSERKLSIGYGVIPSFTESYRIISIDIHV